MFGRPFTLTLVHESSLGKLQGKLGVTLHT